MRTNLNFIGQDQCTVAQQAEILMSCIWAHFPDRFLHYVWTAKWAHSDFVRSRVYVCLGVTCHLHFNNKYICKVLNPPVSNLDEAQSAVHFQWKLSKQHIQLKLSKQRNQWHKKQTNPK